MDIRVSGHQVDTGEALQLHAADRLNAIVDKYFSRALSSTVTFGRAPAGAFRCDLEQGQTVRSGVLGGHGGDSRRPSGLRVLL